jgi:hypothetical protein
MRIRPNFYLLLVAVFRVFLAMFDCKTELPSKCLHLGVRSTWAWAATLPKSLSTRSNVLVVAALSTMTVSQRRSPPRPPNRWPPSSIFTASKLWLPPSSLSTALTDRRVGANRHVWPGRQLEEGAIAGWTQARRRRKRSWPLPGRATILGRRLAEIGRSPLCSASSGRRRVINAGCKRMF